MKRRDFSKSIFMMGAGAAALSAASCSKHDKTGQLFGDKYIEPVKELPVRNYDVVVVGGGTGGVFAATAAARTGAKTLLIETKGYVGGVAVEGGTALHSFYNIWKPFEGVNKKQVVRGMPQEFIDRLHKIGGTTGHGDQVRGEDYDSVCTAIDTELYKFAAHDMLKEAGVTVFLSTLLTGAIVDDQRVSGVIIESRLGREAIMAKSFIDASGYGDLCAFAGADYTEPNDYKVCNSIGLGNVDIEKYYEFLKKNDALGQLAYGKRSGEDDKIIRLSGRVVNFPEGYKKATNGLGISTTTTTVHDNYLMFIKFNIKLPKSPTDRDTVSDFEYELRRRQVKAVEAFREYLPGMKKAFIARTAPQLVIRRGRLIHCDYDMKHEDIINARHFDDEIFNYGFHDSAPRWLVGKGDTYGLPYRAMLVSGLENLFAIGMMITKDHRAHMSTRNTVCCMGQGQAAGAAAAMCAKQNIGARDLKYDQLRSRLLKDNVYLEG